MAISQNKFLKVKDIDTSAGLVTDGITGKVSVVISPAAGNAIEFDQSGALFTAAPIITDVSQLPNNAISLISGKLYAPIVTSTTGVFTRLPTVTASSGQTVVSVIGLPSTYAPTPSQQSSGLLVFVDGILQSTSACVQTPTDITFVTPLQAGSQVDVIFIGGEFSSGNSPDPLIQRFALTATALTPQIIEWPGFTAPINIDANKFTIHVDGVYQSPSFSYSITIMSGIPSFDFGSQLPVGSQLDITY